MELVNANPSKPKRWLWIVLIIIVLLALGFLAVGYFTKRKQTASTADNTGKNVTETWAVDKTPLIKTVTSSCTITLADKSFRTYYMSDGDIVYADSTDGKTFGAPKPTGIRGDKDMMISNPAILAIDNTRWIMVYEQQQQKSFGNKGQTPPGPDSQRNLYLATSADGIKFTKAGTAIDSSKADDYFASVPDLVKTPDGKIRMYYVSGGDAIGSATSEDAGKTWTREEGYRLKNMAVDPDVLLETSGNATKWVMYYSSLDPQNNALYKATSEDGLTWKSVGKIMDRFSQNGVIVDPDIVSISTDEYLMLLGASSSAEGQLDLYRATFKGDIFE